MTSDGANGFQSELDSEEFHQMMRDLYAKQHQSETFSRIDENQYHVQAKLPSPLYTKFYQLLKDQGWSKSTGVQYAIYKLLNEQP